MNSGDPRACGERWRWRHEICDDHLSNGARVEQVTGEVCPDEPRTTEEDRSFVQVVSTLSRHRRLLIATRGAAVVVWPQMLLSRLIERMTGRTYSVRVADLPYMVQKGGVPLLRGAAWSALRFRRPRGFLLGNATRFLQSGQLALGRGVSIGAFGYFDCAATQGIRLGDGVTIREYAWVQGRSGLNAPAHGLTIGDRSYVGPFAQIGIGGPIEIGSDVQLGAGISIIAESHVEGPDGSYVSGHVTREGVRIGDRCWVGNNVTILDGVDVGHDCVIGAGSVVTRDIPPHSIAYGVPAKARPRASSHGA